MPAKKTTTKASSLEKDVKNTVKKVEKKVENVKRQLNEESKFVKEEGKQIITGIEKWWNKSSTEEKIYTILGVVALIWGILLLRDLIWGGLLIVIGILFVTGYFSAKK